MRVDDPRRPIILLMITGALVLLAGFAGLMIVIKKKLNEAEEVRVKYVEQGADIRLPADYEVQQMLVTEDDRALLHVTSPDKGSEILVLDMKSGSIISRLPEADDPATGAQEVPE